MAVISPGGEQGGGRPGPPAGGLQSRLPPLTFSVTFSRSPRCGPEARRVSAREGRGRGSAQPRGRGLGGAWSEAGAQALSVGAVPWRHGGHVLRRSGEGAMPSWDRGRGRGGRTEQAGHAGGPRGPAAAGAEEVRLREGLPRPARRAPRFHAGTRAPWNACPPPCTLKTIPRLFQNEVTPPLGFFSYDSLHLFLSMRIRRVRVYVCMKLGVLWLSHLLFEKSLTEPRSHCFCFTGWPQPQRFLLSQYHHSQLSGGLWDQNLGPSCVRWHASTTPALSVPVTFSTSQQSNSPRLFQMRLFSGLCELQTLGGWFHSSSEP